MTDRERWTVYPLLFLALGIALRSSGKFGPTKMISCEHLLVATPDGKAGIELVALSDRGILTVRGENGQRQVVLESTPNGGLLATLSPNQVQQVFVEPTPFGGSIATFDVQGRPRQGMNFPEIRIPVRPIKPPPGAEVPTPAEQAPAEPQQPTDDAETKPAEPAGDQPAPAEKESPAGDNAPAGETAPASEDAKDESHESG